MKKLLLTAFEPFGGQALNASLETARALQGRHFEGAQIEVLALPVVRWRAPQLTIDALARFEPDFVVLLGEAGGRTEITPERVAINLDDYPIPDNAGNQPREKTIIEDGPAAYFSTLPLLRIQTALQNHRVPAAISNSAGTYLCNHLFYHVMHHLSETQSATRAGFVHVPLLADIGDRENRPGMARKTMVRGVEAIIETCLAVHPPGARPR